MKTYKATATRQYHDTPEIEPRFLQAENESHARQIIINSFDLSYKWDFKEVKPPLKTIESQFFVVWYKGKERKQTVGYKSLEQAEFMRDSIIKDGYDKVFISKIQKEKIA